MFSYGLCEGLGTVYLLNNMCRYQKNYGKTFFPWFGILSMNILALAICDTRQKKIQYLDISLWAAGPPINDSI